jgi:hypothetical protein
MIPAGVSPISRARPSHFAHHGIRRKIAIDKDLIGDYIAWVNGHRGHEQKTGFGSRNAALATQCDKCENPNNGRAHHARRYQPLLLHGVISNLVRVWLTFQRQLE